MSVKEGFLGRKLPPEFWVPVLIDNHKIMQWRVWLEKLSFNWIFQSSQFQEVNKLELDRDVGFELEVVSSLSDYEANLIPAMRSWVWAFIQPVLISWQRVGFFPVTALFSICKVERCLELTPDVTRVEETKESPTIRFYSSMLRGE